jgi:hypothetical protein
MNWLVTLGLILALWVVIPLLLAPVIGRGLRWLRRYQSIRIPPPASGSINAKRKYRSF